MFAKRFISISLIYIFLTACLQTENSNSNDGFAPEGSDIFIEVNQIFLNNCTTECHTHNYHTLSEEDFVNEGLVMPGDPENSKIYYRLNGSLGPNGAKSMPPAPNSISASEVTLIYDWISSLQ